MKKIIFVIVAIGLLLIGTFGFIHDQGGGEEEASVLPNGIKGQSLKPEKGRSLRAKTLGKRQLGDRKTLRRDLKGDGGGESILTLNLDGLGLGDRARAFFVRESRGVREGFSAFF
ncbi:MAG TPA: hypothetical protein ENK02_04290, partial [Planctomycetes bacterium]|nr:hypothetical protein [Planctomycetota bacterium]